MVFGGSVWVEMLDVGRKRVFCVIWQKILRCEA